MWRLLFRPFGMVVVVTTDHDGELRWRFAFRDPRGGMMARAIVGWVHLNEDGTVNTPSRSYVVKWCFPYSSNAGGEAHGNR